MVYTSPQKLVRPLFTILQYTVFLWYLLLLFQLLLTLQFSLWMSKADGSQVCYLYRLWHFTFLHFFVLFVGAETPVFLALLAPGTLEPHGEFVRGKKVVPW